MSSYSESESLRTVDLLQLSFNRTPLKNASVGRFFFLISKFFSISTSWILRAHKFTIQLTFYIPNWTLTIISGPKRKILNLEIKCNSVTWTVYVTVWHNPGSLVQTLSDIIMFKNTFLYTLLLTFLCFFALAVDF